MGTRHLTIVKLGNKVKVAQYGQWDGYPSGQGKTIAKFLNSESFNLAQFKEEVTKLEWANNGGKKPSKSVSFKDFTVKYMPLLEKELRERE